MLSYAKTRFDFGSWGGSFEMRRMQRPDSRWRLALACALLVAMGAISAEAAPIYVGGAGSPAFAVDPIYFKGFDQFGLTGPGAGPEYFAVSPVPFLSVGNAAGMNLTLAQQLQKPVYQHPQDPANSLNPLTNFGNPTSPTAALPFVADSNWTITNTSGRKLDGVLLLFTKASGATGYPAVDVALDDYFYDTMQYQSMTAGTLYFGAIQLGDLAIGEQVSFPVRYIVADPLLFQGNDFVMPPFGLSALERGSYIPEPATSALLLLGLAVLGRRGWRRCA